MFLLWLNRKFMRWYEEYGYTLKPIAKASYIIWAFLSFVFLFIEKISAPYFFTEGPYLNQYKFLRDVIIPISTITVFIPILIYIGYRIYRALNNQYLEYSYFSESGGKFKNEEKIKNGERKQHEEEEDDELSFDELSKDTYRKAFRLGVQNYVKSASTTQWETTTDEAHPLTPLEVESLNTYDGDVIRENFIRASGYTSLLLDEDASNEDAFYANCLILVSSDNGSSQIRFIVAYNGSSHEAYIDEPWEIPPEDNSKYTIITNQVNSAKDAEKQQTVREGQVSSARPKSIKLDRRASDKDSFYNGCMISIVSGAGTGQSRFVIGYNGNTKVATIDKVWDVIPNDSSIYSLVLSQAYWRSEPAELKNIRNSTIVVDETGTYIRSNENNKISVINDSVWNEEISVTNGEALDDSVASVTDTDIEVDPDFGEKPQKRNRLVDDDGEIIDKDDEGNAITLDDLLKHQKKD
jgi:hypothetical protein